MNQLLANNILQLRAPEPEDLDLLYAWENDTSIWENGASIVPFSRYSIKQYLVEYRYDIYVDKQVRLMIVHRQTGKCIGVADLYDFDPFHRRAGVAILIDKQFRRNGYALLTLSLLEEYAFGFLNLKQLYAVIPEKNNKSLGLFAKAGYHQTGILEEWIMTGSAFMNAVVMQRINGKPIHTVID